MTRPEQTFAAAHPQLAELAQRVPLAIMAPAPSDVVGRATGTVALDTDPITAAERVANERR